MCVANLLCSSTFIYACILFYFVHDDSISLIGWIKLELARPLHNPKTPYTFSH